MLNEKHVSFLIPTDALLGQHSVRQTTWRWNSDIEANKNDEQHHLCGNSNSN